MTSRKRSLLSVFLLLCLLTGCARRSVQPPTPTEQIPPSTPLQSDWRSAVLYFVIVDRYADGDAANNINVDPKAKGTFHGGDLKGLLAHLDQIADLGVNAVWITPVVKNIDGFVTGAGFPDWGYHGYWADDFTRVDPRFGTEGDLKALIDACHHRGIRVLLDVVYNHAGYGSHYLTDPRTSSWFRTEDKGTCGQDDLTSCVAGLPDFKTERSDVAEYLMSAHLGLAKRAGLDGFRLDTVKHVDHPFWKEHRKRSQAIRQDFFLLGEVWGGDPQVLDPWFADNEMDAGFDFSFQGSAISFLLGRGRTVAFDRYLKSREKIRSGYLVSHFLSSHDVPGALYQLNGDLTLFRLAAVLQFTSIGIPMIYYGEEVGRPGGDWPDNRSDMPWGDQNIRPGTGLPRDESLREDYKKLIAIRKAHPALFRGTHEAISTEGNVLVFAQKDSETGDTVIVAINRGNETASLTFDVPLEWGSHSVVKDVWSKIDIPVQTGKIVMQLGSKSASILTAE